jgi:hypothetical protein
MLSFPEDPVVAHWATADRGMRPVCGAWLYAGLSVRSRTNPVLVSLVGPPADLGRPAPGVARCGRADSRSTGMGEHYAGGWQACGSAPSLSAGPPCKVASFARTRRALG